MSESIPDQTVSGADEAKLHHQPHENRLQYIVNRRHSKGKGRRSSSTEEDDDGDRRQGKRRWRCRECGRFCRKPSQIDISDDESETSVGGSISSTESPSPSKRRKSKNKIHETDDDVTSSSVSESTTVVPSSQPLRIDENFQERSNNILNSPLLISKNGPCTKCSIGEITLDMIIEAVSSLSKMRALVSTGDIAEYIQKGYQINSEGEVFLAELLKMLELAAETGEIIRHHDPNTQDYWTKKEDRVGVAESQSSLNRFNSMYLTRKPHRTTVGVSLSRTT